jgi:two-component system, OmpR family, phosphate regulon response regulator OmpR
MRNILVVDDLPEICDLFRMVLECDGSCRVTTAATSGDAVAAMTHHQPDALITDVVLPGPSGLRLASWSLARNIPVLIVTGEPAAQRMLEETGCPYLRKPFGIAALQAEMRALWDDGKRRRSLTAVSLRRMGIETTEPRPERGGADIIGLRPMAVAWARSDADQRSSGSSD